ncbi:MAG: hypothetical protein ACHQXG_06460 [Nitrososphaerales archaeon]
MSKRVSQDTSNTADTNEVLKVKQDKELQSISEVSEQMILDKISENQKKIMKSRAERCTENSRKIQYDLTTCSQS